jgi:tetrahydromethanopterin S-methyltransferase subunit H
MLTAPTAPTSITTDDVRNAANLVYRLVEIGEHRSVSARLSKFREKLTERLADGRFNPNEVPQSVAGYFSVFGAAEYRSFAQNIATMIDAVLARDLLNMEIPKHSSHAFSVNLALLNNRPIPS